MSVEFAETLLDVPFIAMPVNMNNAHWLLVIFAYGSDLVDQRSDPRTAIIVLDSLKSLVKEKRLRAFLLSIILTKSESYPGLVDKIKAVNVYKPKVSCGEFPYFSVATHPATPVGSSTKELFRLRFVPCAFSPCLPVRHELFFRPLHCRPIHSNNHVQLTELLSRIHRQSRTQTLTSGNHGPRTTPARCSKAASRRTSEWRDGRHCLANNVHLYTSHFLDIVCERGKINVSLKGHTNGTNGITETYGGGC